jgi:glycosyltransferase involved in cell wall biosynthesis
MNPSLSIIVCTYNREEYILRNLEALSAQVDFNKDAYEVIVVNNNSPDSTEEKCLSFIKEHPSVCIRYFKEMQQGHTFARNRGIVESKGHILAFLDDDAFVRPNYCQELQDFFNQHSMADMIGGRIYPIYENGEEPKWMTKYLLPLVVALDKGDEVLEYTQNKFPTGANMAFRKEVFEKSGTFNTDLGRRGLGLEGGDEKEMVLRAKKNGFRAFYAPNVIVDHIIPPHRVDIQYVKGLAIGVGKHERTRLKLEKPGSLTKKWLSELIKVGGTFVLAIGYMLKLEFDKATMLVRFRYWVIKGLAGF